jgi:hypothetical protein
VAAAAERVSAERWLQPRAEGKWSPAEIVEHLNLAYEVLLRELNGGPGMQIRTKLWQRLLIRLTIMPKLLRGGPFPNGARAPRETRPVLSTTDKASAIATLRERGEKLASVASDVRQTKPRTRLTHAYFGKGSVENGVLLCARHMQHHHKQLLECC